MFFGISLTTGRVITPTIRTMQVAALSRTSSPSLSSHTTIVPTTRHQHLFPKLPPPSPPPPPPPPPPPSLFVLPLPTLDIRLWKFPRLPRSLTSEALSARVNLLARPLKYRTPTRIKQAEYRKKKQYEV